MWNFLIFKEERLKDEPTYIRILAACLALFFLVPAILGAIIKYSILAGLFCIIILFLVSVIIYLVIYAIRKSRILKIAGCLLYIILVAFVLNWLFGIGWAIGLLFYAFFALCSMFLPNKNYAKEFQKLSFRFNKNYKKAIKAYYSGDFEGAIENLELFLKTKKLRNDLCYIILLVCELYVFCNNFDKALALIDEYKDKYQETMFQIKLSLLKVKIFRKQRLMEESYKALDEAKDKIETIIECHNKKILTGIYKIFMSENLLEENKLDEAEELLNSIPDKFRGQGYYRTKALIYEKQNNIKEAIKYYNKALKVVDISTYNVINRVEINRAIENIANFREDLYH